ncbi:MAG: hypothetical protein QM652_02600 [Legionella sp.]|uniref:hypothetical protein n=1 Tax=Legionella sp. TaxID=459 RepID=UPI0039E35765
MMETDLSIFLTALIHHPVRLATTTLFVAGATYVASSSVGVDNTTSIVSGLVAGSIFTYVNTVNTEKHARRSAQQESIQIF